MFVRVSPSSTTVVGTNIVKPMGVSAPVGPIVNADGFFRVPEAATGLGAGTEVDVELYC